MTERDPSAVWRLDELATRVRTLAHGSSRILLGICGPPAAGKSTVAAALCAELGDAACYLPMDGFHLAQRELRRLGREVRKGAPDTFDVRGFVAMLRELRNQRRETIYVPEFSRDLEDPVAGAIPVEADKQIIVVEGNYLLLESGHWGEVVGLLDEVWYLSADAGTRHRRLVERQLAGGRDLESAEAWAGGSDARNSALVEKTASRAALRIETIVHQEAEPGLPPSAAHRALLARESERLLGFGEAAPLAGGFGWLAENGMSFSHEEVLTRITARMTYGYSLAALWNRPRARELAMHGVRSLRGSLRDESGGWRYSLASSSTDTKTAYDHAFVVLAASAARVAAVPGSRELLDAALGVVLDKFWDDDSGRCVDSFDERLERASSYRGANSSMHLTEAFLAAGHATGDTAWLERATRIIDHIVLDAAAGHDWRVPEHYTDRWAVDLEFNVDRPHDKLRPPGVTPGHGLEWARLCLHAAAAGAPAEGMISAARKLFSRAVEDGWNAESGWLYTVDWNGRPLVSLQPHWVLTEALGTSAALHAVTGESEYSQWYSRFWNRASSLFIDPSNGSWRHELDELNRPSELLGAGRPDIYHALQAMLIPRLPLGSSVLAMTTAGRERLMADAELLG